MTNKSGGELQKRVVTGVLGGAGMVALIVYGGWAGTVLLALVVAAAMIFEFIEMAFSLPDKLEKRYVLLGITWLVVFFNAVYPHAEFMVALMVFLGLGSYFLFTASRHHGPLLLIHLQELVYSFFGLVYLVFLPTYLPMIRDTIDGVHWTLLFFIIVWSCDTGAYFVGRKWGKTPLYARISPKKTIEGAIGGTVVSLVLALTYKLALFPEGSWPLVILVALVVSLMSQVGDLFESFVKRSFDKKDSGSILPGHGGFLDRFDGVIFALPAMYACIRVLG